MTPYQSGNIQGDLPEQRTRSRMQFILFFEQYNAAVLRQGDRRANLTKL